VNLNSFVKDIENFSDPSYESWRRNVFQMFDEAQNLIGRVDLSVSFIKRRRDIGFQPPVQDIPPVQKLDGAKPVLKPAPASIKPQTILDEHNIEQNPS
jgi:hypothetical protein